jgi:hypothetical protein
MTDAVDNMMEFLQSSRLDLSNLDEARFLSACRYDNYPCPLQFGAICLDHRSEIPDNTCLSCNNLIEGICLKGHNFRHYKFLRMCLQVF